MDKKYIPSTGFLYELRPTDYITGASPLDIPEVMPLADWTSFVPTGEKQFKYATFDTFSCTTFSFLNEIETWINWHKANNHFTPNQIATMNSLGFFADGKFNCSDRFTAITSGTLPNGNYFQNVADAVRNKGLLPEAILPFGGNNQLEYLDVSLITPEMFTTAKKILDILDISYEWTNVDTMPNSLKQCPIWGAIPAISTHAIEVVTPTQYFDSYEPYIKTLPVVQYAMKVIVKVKPEIVTPTQPVYKYFSAKEVAKWKLKPELFSVLDTMRKIANTPFIITSGLRTPLENKNAGGVANSAHLRGLAVDLLCIDPLKRTLMLKGIVSYETPVFLEIANKHLHISIDTSINTMGNTIVVTTDD